MMTKPGKDNRVLQAAGAILAIALLYGFFFAVGVGCPIKFVTGISCPGCGMSRACWAAVRGHWHQAYAYHPLFVIPFLAVIYLAVSRWLISRDPGRKEAVKKADKILLWTAVAVMIVCYALRMGRPGQEIVVARPRDSLVYRLFSTFFK